MDVLVTISFLFCTRYLGVFIDTVVDATCCSVVPVSTFKFVLTEILNSGNADYKIWNRPPTRSHR